MVERFNGRISDVLKTNRFDSALDREQTLMRHVVRVLSDQWRSRLTLQHAVAAISLGEQNADASDERLAQIPPAPVRQNAS